MPPLDEGSLLVMPTTFAGIAIEEARHALAYQHKKIMGFAEVASVHGKAGRAETATDPAQLDMIESVIALKPRDHWPEQSNGKRRTIEQLARDIEVEVRMPGYQMTIAPPIRTRIDMLTTGVRTPAGVKVFGSDLKEIERISVELEGLLRAVPGTRSTFAERQTGREYIDIVPDRDAIARYGLTVRDVHDVIEAAVGGMPVSTVIAGRSRFSVNLRYGAAYRADPEALRGILVPIRTSEPLAEPERLGAGRGAAQGMAGDETTRGAGGGMTGMGGGGVTPPAAPTAGPAGMPPGDVLLDPAERYRQTGAAVPLGVLAKVEVVSGPPMIKDENGVLVGYVFADIDLAQRDLGGWVNDAKKVVAKNVQVPPGYRLAWTGQYEFQEEMEARMAWALPLALLLVIILLRLAMRGWAQTSLVLTSLPFALTGSIWLLFARDYNLSTAVWVGLIAVLGTAVETGILMVEFLDEALAARSDENAPMTRAQLDDVIVGAATARIRPVVMSVASTVLGLLPLMWEAGPGADVAARIAAPLIGGLGTCMLLTLVVLPAIYCIWRDKQNKVPGVRATTGGLAS